MLANKSRVLFWAVLVLGIPAWGQSPYLLLDINRKYHPNSSSNPRGYENKIFASWRNPGFPRSGKVVFFAARDPEHGEELWKSDGTLGGTVLVKDIYPGRMPSFIRDFIVFKGVLFFSAQTRGTGREVWRSDGTPQGTYLFYEGRPGYGSGGFESPVVMGGRLYWCSFNGATYDLVSTDGTGKGTEVVFRGFTYAWKNPVALDSKIIFGGYDPQHGLEPWVTDGTTAGTRMILDLHQGASSTGFDRSFRIGNKALFQSSAKDHGLYVTDGTAKGTKLVYRGLLGMYYQVSLGNKVLFQGNDLSHGLEPWVTDGTPGGTRMLADLLPGRESGRFEYPQVFKGGVLFQGKTAQGSCIMFTDGTPEGTRVFSRKSKYFKHPAYSGGLVFFRGLDPAWKSSTGEELWVTDGTDQGTRLVKDIFPGPNTSWLFNTTSLGKKVVFSASDDAHGRELWISDGTAEGTRLVKDIMGGPIYTLSSSPEGFFQALGTTFFSAYEETHGRELWKTDGTTLGTKIVKDIYPGKNDGCYLGFRGCMNWMGESGLWTLPFFGRYIYFGATHKNLVQGLWVSDGTAEGTKQVTQNISCKSWCWPRRPVALGNSVLFFRQYGSGYGLWKVSAFGGKEVLVRDGFRKGWSPFLCGNKVLFLCETQKYGWDLWVTDGTSQGTSSVIDLGPGNTPVFIYNAVAVGGRLFFWCRLGYGFERRLYVTDGTSSGTKLLFSHPKDYGDSLAALNGRVFFSGYRQETGFEMWTTDGTPEGTRLVKDICPGKESGRFWEPCTVGNRIFFQGNDDVHGVELWMTDGTAKGTVLVKDIRPGYYSSYPERLASLGSRRVVFKASDGSHVSKLWVSDGTPSGTRMAGGLNPGKDPFDPKYMCLSNGLLFFVAKDASHGYEPWAWFPGATEKPFGWSTDFHYRLWSTDPVLGETAWIGLKGMSWGQAAIFLLADPSSYSLPFAGGWLHFDTNVIYNAAFLSFGPGEKLGMKVPNDSNMVGKRIVAQGFVFPTGRAPFFLDVTNAVMLTFGK